LLWGQAPRPKWMSNQMLTRFAFFSSARKFCRRRGGAGGNSPQKGGAGPGKRGPPIRLGERKVRVVARFSGQAKGGHRRENLIVNGRAGKKKKPPADVFLRRWFNNGRFFLVFCPRGFFVRPGSQGKKGRGPGMAQKTTTNNLPSGTEKPKFSCCGAYCHEG